MWLSCILFRSCYCCCCSCWFGVTFGVFPYFSETQTFATNCDCPFLGVATVTVTVNSLRRRGWKKNCVWAPVKYWQCKKKLPWVLTMLRLSLGDGYSALPPSHNNYDHLFLVTDFRTVCHLYAVEWFPSLSGSARRFVERTGPRLFPFRNLSKVPPLIFSPTIHYYHSRPLVIC